MLQFIRHLFRRSPPAIVVVPAPITRELDLRERMEIRDWLSMPTTQKVLGLVEARHPGLQTSRISKHARSEWDEKAVVNYLNRIAGWESFRNTLLTIAEPPQSRGEPVETYPKN